MEEISCIEGMNARILLQNFAQGEGSVTLHWHKNIEINLILKGSAKFIIDFCIRVSTKHDMYMVCIVVPFFQCNIICRTYASHAVKRHLIIKRS